MVFKKGQRAWNKNLTKETDKRLDYIIPTAFKKGHKPWSYGLTTETNKSIKKIAESKIGKKRADMLGKKNVAKKPKIRRKISEGKLGDKNPMFHQISNKRGKTLEEFYGEERTKEIKKEN